MARYATYVEKQHGVGLVLFLTLDGKRSETHRGLIPYRRISYADHILTWLDKCLRETYHIIPINQALLQYRAVVLSLTGRTIESQFMKPITKFISEHPEIIQFRKQIIVGIDEARANFLDSLANRIEEELKNKHGFQVCRRNQGARFSNGSEGDLILTPPSNSKLRDADFKIMVEYDTEKPWGVAVGISGDFLKDGPTDTLRDLFLRIGSELKLKANGRYHVEPTRNWPTGWQNLIEPMDDKTVAELMAAQDKTIFDVCNGILDYIKLLEQIYADAIQQTNIQP